MNVKETPRERFKRIATYRVNMVLDRLDKLANCANRNYYEYTEEDVKEIFRVIETKVKEVKALFTFSKKKKFKL